MYNDQFVYKVVIGAFLGIILWTEKVALSKLNILLNEPIFHIFLCCCIHGDY